MRRPGKSVRQGFVGARARFIPGRAESLAFRAGFPFSSAEGLYLGREGLTLRRSVFDGASDLEASHDEAGFGQAWAAGVVPAAESNPGRWQDAAAFGQGAKKRKPACARGSGFGRCRFRRRWRWQVKGGRRSDGQRERGRGRLDFAGDGGFLNRGGDHGSGRGRSDGFSRRGTRCIAAWAATHTRNVARHHRRDFTGTRVQAGPIIGSAGATDQQKGKNKRLGHAVHDLSPKTARKRLQCPARMAIRPAFTVCARSSAG